MLHFNICLPQVLVSIFREYRLGIPLCQNWRLASLGTLIGVPHTSIRFWDLRYFYDTRSFLQLPFPDLIAVNGPHAKRMFWKADTKTTNLSKLSSAIYVPLVLLFPPSIFQINPPLHDLFQLLVLGDYLPKP